MEYEVFFMFFVSFVLSISFVTMLAACLCCRKKVPKNELLGLEGMVKLKNPDDNIVNRIPEVSIDPKASSSSSTENEAKRVSNAPHRSLPDIPVSEPTAVDTGSDLYATVGDKVIEKPQGRSPNASVKKLASISQHSSISQADDVSSPYARVRSPSHAYDKVRPTEHPYAQVTTAGTNTVTPVIQQLSEETLSGDQPTSSRRGSNESLLGNAEIGQVIPAASAIAGRISASQELPYMTPPIVQPPIQHFSGDSQDSSKGYTSISVREPLANIIAQTNQQNAQLRRRDLTDSHYATVSDDSDEMYAAIDDPNNLNHVDLYTSGSETYAQIQPPVPMTVAVEINQAPSTVQLNEENVMTSSISSTTTNKRQSVISVPADDAPVPTVVENLRTVHSRQASSSSCTSSVGNLGSPKPEKRQANSPLPPTPKNSTHLSNSNLTSISSIPSGRNSVASVIECHVPSIANASRQVSRENLAATDLPQKSATLGSNVRLLLPDKSDEEAATKKKNPSKNLEGMYAKVMKKNKLSNAPSQNTSPVPYRKSYNDVLTADRQMMFASDPDIAMLTGDRIVAGPSDALSKSVHIPSNVGALAMTPSLGRAADNDYETIDKRRSRSNSYDTKDPGYETIPANKTKGTSGISTVVVSSEQSVDTARASVPPAGLLAHGIHKVSHNSLAIFHEMDKYSASVPTVTMMLPATAIDHSASEPGYESLPDLQSLKTNDPGYETVNISGGITLRKPNSDYDPNYEVLRPAADDMHNDELYAKVWEHSVQRTDSSDGYSSIQLPRAHQTVVAIVSANTVETANGIDEVDASMRNHDYARISGAKKSRNYLNNNNIDEEEEEEDDAEESSEIYTSITATNQATTNAVQVPSYLSIDNGVSEHNYSTISESQPNSSIGVSRPNHAMSTSGYSIVSNDTKTTPSSDSNSSDTQIGYNSIRSTNDDSSRALELSNYESLTGSESDPNYESVRYIDVAEENPYERLYNDSGISPDTLHPTAASTIISKSPIDAVPKSTSTSSDQHVEVGDYFQV